MESDIRFYFDPVCPFCWLTSKWVRMVQAERDLSVDWRFISLRLINQHIDYDAHFPPEYEAGHTAGLRLLRVVARARAEHGAAAVDSLQATLGAHVFDTPPGDTDAEADPGRAGTREFLEPVLREVGLPTDLADALDDPSWDEAIRADGDEALALTGKDVGTPIIHFEPPDGVAFFGPVISRLPEPDRAGELWDHVVGLARFPGFAELKRSLRERPQLVAFGVEPGTVGVEEDWHGGSRRQRSERG
ncbi:thioredoxin-like reductase [Nocardioides flavus (ex Wang et al. 2016)]|uniref:Thioredoxin-like reductase n=1 Tax=Nocardioides flavus (ex Wang et al. 2016) TaxID=2058780 RepID=A0ABQ3HIC8_9ACTN|nr:DsbA family protein [Nocardioides flavus (ex Wang et al. 2016)]GHE15674.1 thioredoxin-like reductase [Nocardioides flavus (ex Wang et al. 2016)]